MSYKIVRLDVKGAFCANISTVANQK